jgi:hypothetical protein
MNMALAFDTPRADLYSLFVAIRTLAADTIAQCASLWQAIEKAMIWTAQLPPRVVRYISVAFHPAVDWIIMVIWTIAKFLLISAGTCVGLLVLALILRAVYRRRRRSKPPGWRAQGYSAELPWGCQRRHSSSTSNWVWYGIVGSVRLGQSLSGEALMFPRHFGVNAAAEEDLGPGANPQHPENAQRHRAGHQPRGRRSIFDRAARDEQVRKQQAERKAEHAAQEQRRNEEQEQRRADARRKLSRDESERIYQRWKSSCDAAFESQKIPIPGPPSWESHVENCKPVGSLRACTCDISRLLSAGSGPKNEFSRRQRIEMIRWHPDKLHFTRRGDRRPAWTEELHKAIKNAEVCEDW